MRQMLVVRQMRPRDRNAPMPDADHTPAAELPPRRRGLSRIFAALVYSLHGLAGAWCSQAAFRQEIMLVAPLSVAIFFVPCSNTLKLIVLLSHVGLLIVELLNSAIEAVVDKASPEFHALARQAKDMGSAAVLLSLVAVAACWIAAVWQAVLWSA